VIDADLLRDTWAEVASYGDEPVLFFYSALFLAHLEVRDLFGADMRSQRAKLAATLSLVVRGAHDLDAIVPTLQQLGRDHRRFGALPEHYGAVARALLGTLEHFLADRWTPEVEKTWTDAVTTVTDVMAAAADQANDAGEQARWDVQILAVDRDDTSALIVIPSAGLPHTHACRAPVALGGEPGAWYLADLGTYDDQSLAFDVEVDLDQPHTLGLVRAHPGDVLRLGPPVADLEVQP
jgi:hemoglobin-like flavoprotein